MCTVGVCTCVHVVWNDLRWCAHRGCLKPGWELLFLLWAIGDIASVSGFIKQAEGKLTGGQLDWVLCTNVSCGNKWRAFSAGVLICKDQDGYQHTFPCQLYNHIFWWLLFKVTRVGSLITFWPVWHLAAVLLSLNISVTFRSHFDFSPQGSYE